MAVDYNTIYTDIEFGPEDIEIIKIALTDLINGYNEHGHYGAAEDVQRLFNRIEYSLDEGEIK